MSGDTTRLVIGPDDGDRITNPIGGAMVVKLRDGDTHGAYSIHDNVLPPGSPGPRPHRHRDHDEVFFVREGILSVRIGPLAVTAPAGSFVVIPRGAVHQPSNPTNAPVHVLLVFSPGGMDGFFAEAAARRLPLQGAPPADPGVRRALDEFTARYGYEFAGLPPLNDERFSVP